MTTILFLADPPERQREMLACRLGRRSGVRLLFRGTASDREILDLAAEADILVGGRPDAEILRSAERAILFLHTHAGADHLIDLFRQTGRKRPLPLATTHGNAEAVAQHAVALLLTLANRIVVEHNRVVSGAGRFTAPGASSTPLHGRRIGLLGWGAVSRRVYRMLTGWDVEISILRRAWDGADPPAGVRPFTPSGLEEFLRQADVLIAAVPLTASTRGLVGSRELRLLGPEGLLINVGRGPVIDQAALYTALKEKWIAGAAIDVWYTGLSGIRDALYDHPFHELENVVLSPYRAGAMADDGPLWDEVAKSLDKVVSEGVGAIQVVDLERGY